jgi:hypothetical protein
MRTATGRSDLTAFGITVIGPFSHLMKHRERKGHLAQNLLAKVKSEATCQCTQAGRDHLYPVPNEMEECKDSFKATQ